MCGYIVACIMLPFAAPLTMHLGWPVLGDLLYQFYSLFCHQLPQRSWFLFGDKLTYTLTKIQQVYPVAQRAHCPVQRADGAIARLTRGQCGPVRLLATPSTPSAPRHVGNKKRPQHDAGDFEQTKCEPQPRWPQRREIIMEGRFCVASGATVRCPGCA